MTLTVEVMAYIALAYSYKGSFYDIFISKAMPTIDPNYSCHTKAINLI